MRRYVISRVQDHFTIKRRDVISRVQDDFRIKE